MKQMKMAMAAGAVMLALSSCGQAENPGEAQTSVMSGTAEFGGSTGGSRQTQDGDIGSSADKDSAESTKAEDLENLTGEYTYVSDDGTGRLIIEKTSYGYDISDYESEASYRFLADSSNIEAIENNRIYLKYPEQVLSDGEAVFGYYILEYDTDGIDVYYGESTFEKVDFLYYSTRKSDTDQPSGNASNMERPEVTGQTDGDLSQQNLSEKIAMEISCAEEQEKEIEKKQKEATTQMEMNLTAAEMYQMWDDTLNHVWGLLEENLNEADMEALRNEEREWITFKDAEVQAAGQECGGGSIQPSIEASVAAELTKARVYELAGYAK